MGGNLVVNILGKIERYAEANVQVNAQILTATKKTNEILSKEVHLELKKQTSLLTKISEVLLKGQGTKIDDVNLTLFGGTKMSGSFIKQLTKKGFTEAKMVSLAKGIDVLAGAITKFAEALDKIDEKKLKQMTGFFSSVAKGIVLFSLAVAFAAPLLLLASLTTLPLIGLWVFAFNLIGKNSKNIRKGAMTMAIMGLGMAVLALGAVAFVTIMGGMQKAFMTSLTVSISLIIMSGAFWLIGKLSSGIVKGALGVLIGAAAVYVLTFALDNWSKADISWEDIAKLGAAIFGLGVVMALAGAVAGMIIPGAIGMLIASVSVMALAKGLEIWMAAKVGWDDIAILGAAVVGLGVAMAGWGVGALFIIPGAAAMGIAAGGLYLFTAGLVNFKKAEWKDKDTDTMLYAMDSILRGFINIFDEIDYDDIFKAMAGAVLLGQLGNSMSQFAQGIAAMAELQAPEYAVKNGQLVLVGTKPLDPNFAEQIATNITVMVDALVSPLARLGAMEGSFFSGPVGKGVELLGDLGNSLSQFAQGVAAMAKLQVPEYAVKNGQLVLVGTKPLDPDFASKVAKNIDMLLSSLIDPISNLGKNSGFFFDSDFEDGLELLGDIGDPIAKLSRGIEAFAKIDANGLSGKKIATEITALVKGISEAFSKKGGYSVAQGASFGFFANTFGTFVENMNAYNQKSKLSDAVVEIKNAINGLDMKKLQKLNSLMSNFKMITENLQGSFDDLEDVLDKLMELVEAINDTKSGSISIAPSTSNSRVAGQLPSDISVNNLDEVVNSLEDIKNALLGTIDVRVEDGLING